MRSKVITLDNQLEVNVSMWGENHNSSIVFLHGLGSTGKSFDELATLLSQHYNVVALDLPGHGRSTFKHDKDFFSMRSLAL